MEKSIHNTDEIIRATGADGYLKMAVITAKHTVQRAREIHNTSPVASAALGRTLCAASLLGNAMKEENGTLTIRVAGDGPIRGVVAVSDSSGCVRGYVGEPFVDLPPRSDGKLDVGTAVGRNGSFTVSALCSGLGRDGLILREIVRIGQDLFSGGYRYGILVL